MQRTIRPEDIAKLQRLRQRIVRWRDQREKRTRMPTDLWDEAVTCARIHGVWQTSQVLMINYASLRNRCSQSSADTSMIRGGFVELKTLPFAQTEANCGFVVEVHRRDGSRLSLKLPPSELAQVTTLVERFVGVER